MRRYSKFGIKESDWPLYRRFFLLVAAIMAILALTYFAGLVVLANLNLFWGEAGPEPIVKKEGPIPPPQVLNLPQATHSATLKIAGFAPEGTTIALFVNEEEVNSQITDKEGQFVFEAVNLNQGENKIYVTGKNQSGAESQPSTTQTVLLDQEPPKVEITSLEDNQIIKEEKDQPTFVSVSGKVSENAAVTVNGRQVIVNGDGIFDHRLRLTEEGENTIKIEATDAAGNKTTVEKTVIYKKLEESES
jgi:hypothetical protein